MQLVPLTNLKNEANATFDSAEMKALAVLKQDPKFRAYTGSGAVSATLDEVGTGQTLPTETKPDEDDAPVAAFLPLKNGDSGRRFKSSKPNQALLWALIDDSPQGAEDHELAVSIMDGWKPASWKGQLWKARIHEPNSEPERVWTSPSMDLIWSGSEWLPHTGLPVVHKPRTDSAPSKVTVRLTELFKVHLDRKDKDVQLEGIRIEDTEVNKAYDAYLRNPEDELDNLKVTIAAYARSKSRMAQYRKFIRRHPEVSTTADDVFMEFTAYLYKYLPSYKDHWEDDGAGNVTKRDTRLDRWINMSWHKHFWPTYQYEIIDYLKSTRFVNNANKLDRGYIRYDYAVRTAEITTDSDAAQANGEVNAVQRLIKEMNDPKVGSPYYNLSPVSKLMLQGALEGVTAKMLAKRTGVTPQHALRLLETAKEEAKAIVAVVPTIQACENESNLLPWPEQNGFDISASAAPSENSLADMVEQFETAITVQQLATILQCSRGQIYKLIDEKRLPALKVGTLVRLDPAQVADWIRSKMTIAA